tara:strand:- start:338 stop:937 length:600 start_codon:yes stop_codon:yes gene_type:complete
VKHIINKILIVFTALAMWAAPVTGSESVLGTSGNETLLTSPSLRLFASAGFAGTMAAAGDTSWSPTNRCGLFSGVVQISSTYLCSAPQTSPAVSKDTTLTRFSVVTGGVANNVAVACKVRLWANGSAIESQEIVIEAATGTAITQGTTYTAVLSPPVRIPAGAQLGIQFANGAQCATGTTCRCGGNVETLWFSVYGVQH